MITKSKEAKCKEFKGVTFDVLAVGEQSMVTKMKYKLGDKVSLHAHPNEQSGYVISGKYQIRVENTEDILTSGDSYSIPANIPHSWTVIEAGEVIDVFTPVRKDYL